MYGTTLRLPDLFGSCTAADAVPDPFNYVNRLRVAMQQLKTVPSRQYQNKAFVSSDLLNCSHAFVHQDSVHRPLQQPYDSPYHILSRADKHFTVDVNSKKSVISLDRLKPVYLDLLSTLYITSRSTTIQRVSY